MSLDRAIEQLSAEIADFQQGTKQAPKDGTVEWFLLRAKSLGLSHLKRMKQLGVESDVAASERFYRKCSSSFKQLNVPDPVEIEKEVLPSDTLPG